jgi:hypothetical protein
MARKKFPYKRTGDPAVSRLGYSQDPFTGHGLGFEDRQEPFNTIDNADFHDFEVQTVGLEPVDDGDPESGEEEQLEEHNSIQNNPISASGVSVELESLYVLTPEDTDELSLEELETVWSHREELCGSVEVAAEVLSLLEKSKSNDESFKGWKSYINHQEIRRLQGILPSLRDIEAIDGPDSPSIHGSDDLDPYRTLTRTDVEKLNTSEVQEAWNGRPYSFGSISAACEALALLRMYQGTDAIKRPWNAFINHDSIRQLYDYLDDDTQEEISPSEDLLSLLKADNRQKVSSQVTVREGQGGFREQLIREYGCRCCISGCEEGAVIEAAHIKPYKGKQTNILENGLLMRVDLHRLFDKYLIAVEAESLTVRVASSVTDEYYRSLHGMKLKCRARRKTRQFLREHYDQFLTLGSSQN